MFGMGSEERDFGIQFQSCSILISIADKEIYIIQMGIKSNRCRSEHSVLGLSCKSSTPPDIT